MLTYAEQLLVETPERRTALAQWEALAQSLQDIIERDRADLHADGIYPICRGATYDGEDKTDWPTHTVTLWQVDGRLAAWRRAWRPG